MLILGRKEDEKIRIIVGPEAKALYDKDGQIIIDIQMVLIRGGACRIGFEADKSVRIVRSEIALREGLGTQPQGDETC